jgi:hypothetical protein
VWRSLPNPSRDFDICISVYWCHVSEGWRLSLLFNFLCGSVTGKTWQHRGSQWIVWLSLKYSFLFVIYWWQVGKARFTASCSQFGASFWNLLHSVLLCLYQLISQTVVGTVELWCRCKWSSWPSSRPFKWSSWPNSRPYKCLSWPSSRPFKWSSWPSSRLFQYLEMSERRGCAMNSIPKCACLLLTPIFIAQMETFGFDGLLPRPFVSYSRQIVL